jgi:glutathione peroxidase
MNSKTTLIISFLLITINLTAQNSSSIYDFKATDIDGNEFYMNTLKGKKVMIVNTASQCGLTPQYADLEKLYQEYKDKNFIIIAFPANNFLQQEPGSNEEIKSFCSIKYKISFPIMSKISVKGENIHPLYKWLTQKSLNGKLDAPVIWNFQKFLIDENGQLVDSVFPKEKPYSEKIIQWLNK